MLRRYTRKPRRTQPYRKKYGKKYGRRRFKNKRFQNGSNALSMRATLAAKQLRLKLPWVKTFNTSVSASGSTFLAFQGNGLVPYTVGGQTGIPNTPAAGDLYPAGALEYSQLYDRYYVNASSIKIEAVSTNSQALAASPLVRAVLLAVPFTQNTTTSAGDDNWGEIRDQLNTYTYEQLLAWQYAKWRMLGSNTGGASRLIFSMFRKTKSMCGIKDIKDNFELSGRLPDGTTAIGDSALALNPFVQGFMYYLRFFNADDTTAAPIQITVRMKLYITMTSREFTPMQTIVANP